MPARYRRDLIGAPACVGEYLKIYGGDRYKTKITTMNALGNAVILVATSTIDRLYSDPSAVVRGSRYFLDTHTAEEGIMNNNIYSKT